MLSPAQIQAVQNQVIGELIAAARQQPDRKFQIRDESGAVIATFMVHDTPVRPKDMPRHLRPKFRLSKRQRDAVKREKLAIPA